MIQLQISIDLSQKDNRYQVAVNRLAREDANEIEGLLADAFEAQFKATLDEVVRQLRGMGVEMKFYVEIDGDGQWRERQPPTTEQEDEPA